MEFITEQEANEARERAARTREVAREESYYASIGLSHPSKWAEEDRLEREAEEAERQRWRQTDNYKRTIAALKNGGLIQLFP